MLRCPIDNLPCDGTGCSFRGGWNEQCSKKNMQSKTMTEAERLQEQLKQKEDENRGLTADLEFTLKILKEMWDNGQLWITEFEHEELDLLIEKHKTNLSA